MKPIADTTCEHNRTKVKPRASNAEAYLQYLKWSKQKLFAQITMSSWPKDTVVTHFRKTIITYYPIRQLIALRIRSTF
jgi:hypothetical protein